MEQFQVALGKFLEQQQKLLRLLLSPFTGIFTHSLLILRENNFYIRLERIHPHWFLDRASSPTAYLQPSIILDPLTVAQGRGRPRGALNHLLSQ